MIGFTPVVPATGIAGWKLLDRIYDRQMETFAKSPTVKREIEYFQANVNKATDVDKLVDDPRLYRFALAAFGMEEEYPKKAFMKRIIGEGTEDKEALAARLVDDRYRKIADTFGYGNAGGARVGEPGFAADLTQRYLAQKFEEGIGATDDDMRLALYFRRTVEELNANPKNEKAGWFKIMGQPPLRRVIEGAFGLPQQFGQIDVDAQKSMLERKAQSVLGGKDLTVLKDPAKMEKVIVNFLARAQLDKGPDMSSPAGTALTLLQTSNGFGSGFASLFAR